MTITIPPELAAPLTAMAARIGTTPQSIVLDYLRSFCLVAPPPPDPSDPKAPKNLLEFLGNFVGSIDGTDEPCPHNCGRLFADGLVEDRRGRP